MTSLLIKKSTKRSKEIGLIAPGYPFDSERIDKAQNWLEKVSWELVIPKNILCPDLYHSAPLKDRQKHLITHLKASGRPIIWAARGGYGSNQLLPFLRRKKSIFKKSGPKLLVGLSDITSLHLFWNLELGWMSLHAPIFEAFGSDNFPRRWRIWWENFLRCGSANWAYEIQSFSNKYPRRIRSGAITGGNLSVLASHVGTPVLRTLEGWYLFLEEVGERAYRIDRYLQQLSQSGLLEGCLGIFWGEITGGEEPKTRSRDWIEATIFRFVNETKIPIWRGIPSGHGPGMGVLPFGSREWILHRKDKEKWIFEFQVSLPKG